MGAIRPNGLFHGTRALPNATVYFAKQDLPFSERLDTVKSTTKDHTAAGFGVYGEKAMFTANFSIPSAKMQVLATFADLSPAVL